MVKKKYLVKKHQQIDGSFRSIKVMKKKSIFRRYDISKRKFYIMLIGINLNKCFNNEENVIK